MCPYHKRLCYGGMQEYYDTTIICFDCGTLINGEYWEAPRMYKRLAIYQDGDIWRVWNPATLRDVGESKTKAGIERIARYHLKSGGKIKGL